MIQNPSMDIAETNLVEEWKSVKFIYCTQTSDCFVFFNCGWSNLAKY